MNDWVYLRAIVGCPLPNESVAGFRMQGRTWHAAKWRVMLLLLRTLLAEADGGYSGYLTPIGLEDCDAKMLGLFVEGKITYGMYCTGCSGTR